MRSTVVFLLLAVVFSARAATYLVGTDRALIRSSAAIVIATAGDSQSIRGPRGTIETSTRMHVEEAIAGPIGAGDDVDVVELGGVVGHTGLAVAGSPRFANGERILLMLGHDSDGSWTTRAMALGRFTFARDVAGRELLVRDEGEIAGFDSDWTPHHELRRDAALFLRFVRDTAAGGDPPADYFVPRAPLAKSSNAIAGNAAAASTYCIQQNGRGIRWNTFPNIVTFLINGSQPGVTDGGTGAAQRGVACWTNDPNSNIEYVIGGSTTSTNGLKRADGTNSIVFNDPTDLISGPFPGSGDSANVLAIGGAWFDTSVTHTFNGETFYTITEADLVVQDGINTTFAAPGLNGNGFDHVLAHELGHTLGFRHSDRTPDDQSVCNPSAMECTSDALMNSGVDFNNDTLGAHLRPWDQDAAAAVYGAGAAPVCTPPSITQQPVSAAFNNADVVLSVTAAGTTPFSYQWYIGSKGDTRNPTGGNGPTLTVSSLAQTTNYWVRVTGQCAPAADSATATITVNGCPAVALTSTSSDTTIIQGRTQTLSASASSSGHPLTYQWFAGAIGDKSRPAGTGATITIAPQSTTTYWLLVSNDCGASATSEPITITVTPCDQPQVVIQPADAQAIVGNFATLAATVSGTSPLQLQWYQGSKGDTSHLVTNATTSSFTTGALTAAATFWLDATNPCGEVQTNAATVTVVPSCTPPVIIAEPKNATVAAGTSAILSVDASGPSLTYEWYEGQAGFDFTHKIGGSSPAVVTPAISVPTQFWVRVTNPCGVANSLGATVKPGNVKRRAVHP